MSSGANPQLTIVLPSFRDLRIMETIASIRAFDDCRTVRILVIDGGSAPEIVDAIAAQLTEADVLVSERDKGIFDGLNKGLERVDTPYMGWIGSDDLFSGEVKSSEVVAALAEHDLFITSLAFIDERWVRRVTHSWPSAVGLSLLGLHNPHYATFGRTALLASERFDIADVSADIDYFLRVFAHKPRIARTAAIGTLQGEGGFSNSSMAKVMTVNGKVFESYRRHANLLIAALGVGAKLSYKALGRLYFTVRPVEWRSRFPVAHEVQARARAGAQQL